MIHTHLPHPLTHSHACKATHSKPHTLESQARGKGTNQLHVFHVDAKFVQWKGVIGVSRKDSIQEFVYLKHAHQA